MGIRPKTVNVVVFVDEGAETEVDENDDRGSIAPQLRETLKRKKKGNKKDSFIRPAAVGPPKKKAKAAGPTEERPTQKEPTAGDKIYECLRCMASGSYATVAMHLKTRHGIKGKITFGVDV